MRRIHRLIQHISPTGKTMLTTQFSSASTYPLQQSLSSSMSVVPIDEAIVLKRQELHSQPLNQEDVLQCPIKFFYKWLEDAVAVKSDMPEKMVLSTVNIEEDGSIQPCARVVLLKDVCFDNTMFSPYALMKGINAYPTVHVSDFFNEQTSSQSELQGLSARGGFCFVTNYNSNKGKQLAANPRCGLNFHWPELERVVRVSGVAYKVPASLSDRYHDQRPRGSQLAALTSHQSRPVESREMLETRYRDIDQALQAGITDIPDIEENIPTEKKEKLQTNLNMVPRPENWGGYVIIPSKFEFWQGRGSRFHERLEVTADLTQDGKWTVKYLQP